MEGGSDAYVQRKVSATGRNFLLEASFYSNGCFLSISEGERKLGAISVALSSSSNTSVVKVIPSRNDPLFANTVAEKVASMINGICAVSFHATTQLRLEDMKAIMGEVMNIVEERKDKDGR
ncbi:hypothetical protein [Nitrososphaera sp.]|uniref:hypothetical protein n=1 Tax=Nitrososphaera sp. TaxID=1971748 RepID=UPI002EDA02F6